MKFKFTWIILLICFTVEAQSLASENLAHLYDPTDEIEVEWLMVKQSGKITVNYAITSTSNSASDEMYLMEWEKRESLSQRQGKTIQSDSMLLSSGGVRRGELAVAYTNDPWILFLKITQITTSKTWSFPFLIEKNYPVNGFVSQGDEKLFNPYLKIGQAYTFNGPTEKTQLYVYRYTQDFTSAYPPFSKNTGPADPLLLPDSSFTIANGSKLALSREGLYLVQADTMAAEGYSFRVSSGSFPKYTRIQDLVEPLVFICTKDEFSKLQQANGDKVAFDQVIMGITRDKDRAKRFMKSYYSRVELANKFFTSYKEGWKSDRGMIYIIFGLPDEIRKTSQNEIWYYKDSRTKFVFIKKGSVYDPDYYTLMRDDRFTQLWYNTIDLWRKSRF